MRNAASALLATVLVAAAPVVAQAQAAGAAEAGRRVFNQCRACHIIENNGRNGVGPNLYAIVGAKHAHADGFNYSGALRGMADKPWTYEELNAWLANPRAYAPGNRMSYGGMANAAQRADLIAYLRSISPNAPAP